MEWNGDQGTKGGSTEPFLPEGATKKIPQGDGEACVASVLEAVQQFSDDAGVAARRDDRLHMPTESEAVGTGRAFGKWMRTDSTARCRRGRNPAQALPAESPDVHVPCGKGNPAGSAVGRIAEIQDSAPDPSQRPSGEIFRIHGPQTRGDVPASSAEGRQGIRRSEDSRRGAGLSGPSPCIGRGRSGGAGRPGESRSTWPRN